MSIYPERHHSTTANVPAAPSSARPPPSSADPVSIYMQVGWGKFSMVEAERRLLATALLDPDNQQFVLLSESWHDPGPHGVGRYSEHMLPEVEKKHFRKGSQWFTMKRKHAIIIMADSLYYTKFKHYCRVFKAGSVKVEKLMNIERYSHVMNISSTVTGELLDNLTS